MDNHVLLERMNEADLFLLNNLDEQNKFKNPNDIHVRVLLYNLDIMYNEFDQSEDGILKRRFDKIRSVFKCATGARLSPWEENEAKDYFTYIADTKETYERGISSVEQALSNIANALKVSQVPDEYSSNYILAQSGINGLTQEQKARFDAFIPLMNKISEIEKLSELEFQKPVSDNQALVVQKEKPAFLKKILDFFRTKFSKQKPTQESSIGSTVSAAPSTFKEEIKAEQTRFKTPVVRDAQPIPEHIVISDLHGNINHWNMIKEELKKNPKLKVTILGDAMDRGEFGPEILLQIKELCDKGSVQYLPGNHDIFAYNYLKMKEAPTSQPFTMAKAHLEHNGGKATMEKLDNFQELVAKELANGNIKKHTTLAELADWLGNQPIQKKVTENNNLYNLSHAVFDEKLYAYDKNFNLSKALSLELNGGKNSEMYRRFLNCMWYRADDTRTHFYDLVLPRSGISVVGHTPQKEVNLQHIQNRPVIVVDTGNGSFSGYSLNSSKNIDFGDPRYR